MTFILAKRVLSDSLIAFMQSLAAQQRWLFSSLRPGRNKREQNLQAIYFHGKKCKKGENLRAKGCEEKRRFPPRKRCRRWRTPCRSCKWPWGFWGCRVCGWPCSVARRTERKPRSSVRWGSSGSGSASAGNPVLVHLRTSKRSFTLHAISNNRNVSAKHQQLYRLRVFVRRSHFLFHLLADKWKMSKILN